MVRPGSEQYHGASYTRRVWHILSRPRCVKRNFPLPGLMRAQELEWAKSCGTAAFSGTLRCPPKAKILCKLPRIFLRGLLGAHASCVQGVGHPGHAGSVRSQGQPRRPRRLCGELLFGCSRAAPFRSHTFASSVLPAGCGWRPKHRLADHVLGLLDSELCQNGGSHIRERRTLHDNLLVTK